MRLFGFDGVYLLLILILILIFDMWVEKKCFDFYRRKVDPVDENMATDITRTEIIVLNKIKRIIILIIMIQTSEFLNRSYQNNFPSPFSRRMGKISTNVVGNEEFAKYTNFQKTAGQNKKKKKCKYALEACETEKSK